MEYFLYLLFLFICFSLCFILSFLLLNFLILQFLYGSAHVMRQPLFRQACELAFAKCDRTGNNYISRNELGDSVRPAIPNLNEDEVNEMYDLFDVGNAGRVDKEDFVSCLRKNPLLIPLFSSVLRREDLLEDGDSSLEETL